MLETEHIENISGVSQHKQFFDTRIQEGKKSLISTSGGAAAASMQVVRVYAK